MIKFGHTKHVTDWEIRLPPTYGRLNWKSKNPMTGDIPWCCQGLRRSSAEAVPWIPWLPQHNFLLKELKGYDVSVSTTQTIRNQLEFHQQLCHSPIRKPEKEEQTEINTPAHRLFIPLFFRPKISQITAIPITSSTMCALNRPNFRKPT